MSNPIKDGFVKAYKFAYATLAKTPLRRIPGIAKFANKVFRFIWARENILEIQGSKMFIDFKETNQGLRQTFQAYAMNRIHEATTTGIFRKILKPGHVFLDLGANIGYFSLLASKLVGDGGKVFAFEPETKNFFYLKKNIEVNGYKNIFPFQKAVSNQNGITKLFFCEYDSGHHTINQCEGVDVYSHGRPTVNQATEIEMVKLDDFLADKTTHVDVIKMDIEGAEALAVDGLKGILTNNREIIFLMEFFPLFIEKMGSSPEALFKMLKEELGFNIWVIGHDYSMEDKREDLVKVNSFDELMALIKDEEDHLNLYISHEENPKF